MEIDNDGSSRELSTTSVNTRDKEKEKEKERAKDRDRDRDRDRDKEGIALMAAIDPLLESLCSNPQPQVRLAAMNTLLRELRGANNGWPLSATADIVIGLRACLTDTGKEIRANAFRILRHVSMIEGRTAVTTCIVKGIDIFIVRALTRDHRFDLEREQAIKLVRVFIDVDAILLSTSIVRILVALAENPEDKLRFIAVETLCEIAILNVPLVTACAGIRIIFGALGDPTLSSSSSKSASEEASNGLSNVIVATVLYLMDSWPTRSYLRPEVEMESVISCLTDTSTPPDKIKSCTQILTSFLKSWTGIFYLSMNSKRSYAAIVDCLVLPNDVCRIAVLEMLFGVLGIKTPGSGTDLLKELSKRKRNDSVGGFYHYQCVVLMVFIDVGLLETLSKIIQTETKEVSSLSMILASEIQLRSASLPPSYASRIQSMSSLFETASNFSNEVDRHFATAAFAHIDSFYETASTARFSDVKEVVGGQIEDAQFRTIVADAEKNFMRDSGKWNWDFIQEFLQILLNNSRRADEVLKTTKILRRLLSFFKPVGSGFGSDMSQEDVEVLRVTGCNLMRVLLSCNEGVKLLNESKFMAEIAEEFNRLDSINGPLPADALFGKNRVQHYSSGIYFNFLSELSNSPSGIGILARYKIFNMYYLITELQSRDDLIKALINAIDFSKDGHERIILSKFMTSSEKDVRFFTTDFVGKLLFSKQSDENTRVWCVELLVTQMYDPVKEIRDKAKLSLDAACELPGVLEAIMVQNPAYHLDTLTNQIYMRFLRTPHGYAYLQSYDYVQGEMNSWIQFGIFNYVTRVELLLDNVYLKSNENEYSSMQFPCHFYGELSKTSKGCAYLKESGHFDLFVRIIRENKQDTISAVSCLKACLWAVGHIGSSLFGMSFLIDTKIVKNMTEIATNSNVLSLRGTCVYVLSLLGHSTRGIEVLQQFDWDVLPPSSEQQPIALPRDLSKLINIKVWEFKGTLSSKRNHGINLHKLDSLEQDILRNIGTLSNHIVAKGASKNLARIRQEHPQYFTRVSLYLCAMTMLSQMHYRLTARRFIQELFDKVVFEEAVLDKWLELFQS
ncbi:hypothetical protein HK100_010701 [Physocladia obscura]|uniref:ARM repeat superfamily protein n=1 Tax=Physocladia obscura TaxID=109957 RepID=A0AAD5T8Z5_9FUNG|nr:hypothetical protein HK100_010701 [Physocladia obscura]